MTRLWSYYLLYALPLSLLAASAIGIKEYYAPPYYHYTFSVELFWPVLVVAALVHVGGSGFLGLRYVKHRLDRAGAAPQLPLLRFTLAFYAVTVGASFLLVLLCTPIWFLWIFFFAMVPNQVFFVPYQLIVGFFLGMTINYFIKRTGGNS